MAKKRDFSKRGSRFAAFTDAAKQVQKDRDVKRGQGELAGGKFLSNGEKQRLEDNELRIRELQIDSSRGYAGEAGDLHSANFKIRQGRNTLDPSDDQSRVSLAEDFF